jgi:hypothetical protein
VIFEQLAFGAVLLLGAASTALLLTRSWRVYVVSLAVQYLAVFWLVSVFWPVGLAAVKLVVGWMSSAVLASSGTASDLFDAERGSISGLIFRLLAVIMVWVLSFSLVPAAVEWLPATMMPLWGGILLIGMGALQLGMTTRIIRVVVGLLTMLAGFEILYAVIETSVLVAGLLAVINLGVALVGSYLLALQVYLEEG